MIIETTETYDSWIKKLKDGKARSRIEQRLLMIEEKDHFGDHESVGDKVFELRIHYGPGYRIYFYKDGNTVIILLCAGTKGTQKKDIEKAKNMIK